MDEDRHVFIGQHLTTVAAAMGSLERVTLAIVLEVDDTVRGRATCAASTRVPPACVLG
jgi:hypothetical protein